VSDQAEALRKAVAAGNATNKVRSSLRCLAVGSGKGGVGKTMISIGLACVLTRWQYKVLIIDADLGLANVDLQLGVDPVYTLQDVVFGNCPIADAIVTSPYGPDLLASSSGAPEMVDMGNARREILVNELMRFSGRYDFLIIDGAAGIGQSIISFFTAAPEVAIVVANEPTSIMDAYSLIKVLLNKENPPSLKLVLNMVNTLAEGDQLAANLNAITKKFLGVEIPVAGIIPFDPQVRSAIRARQPVTEFAPGSPPAHCIEDTARFFTKTIPHGRGGIPDGRIFFEQLARVSLTGSGGG